MSQEQSSIKTLSNFINAAQKSRKYPSGTASNLRNALKLIESSLNEDELVSVNKLKDNLEQIFSEYYRKNSASVSASSLTAYKSRARKVITDYLAYGSDPSKMANWNPALRVRKPKQKKQDESFDENLPAAALSGHLVGSGPTAVGDILKFELPVSPDELYAVYAPSLSLLKKKHVEKLKKYVTYLESIADEE